MNNISNVDPVYKIFSYLTKRDLGSCSRVSKCWNEKTTDVIRSLFFKVDQVLTSCDENNLYNVHVVTNEKRVMEVASQLIFLPNRGNTFVGVSAFSSLNMAFSRNRVQGNIKYIIICDISLKLKIFWILVEKFFKVSNTCKEFVERVDELIYVKNRDFLPKTSRNIDVELKAFMKNHLLWMQNEPDYQSIRLFFLENRFSFVLIDLAVEKSTKQLSGILKRLSLKVDTLYISNLLETLNIGDYISLGKGIEALAHAGTYLIDTEDRYYHVTPATSRNQKDLLTPVYDHIKKTTNDVMPLQRLREFNSLKVSLPLCDLAEKLAAKDQLETLFYQYGRLMKFCN